MKKQEGDCCVVRADERAAAEVMNENERNAETQETEDLSEVLRIRREKLNACLLYTSRCV